MKPHKLLLIEDDLSVQEFAKAALEAAGFSVDAAPNGAEGLRQFGLRRPDLAVIDIGLPDMSGFEACKAMGLGTSVDTPFVFLTARDDLQTRLDAFALGAHDYIQKPFAAEELAARVRVHLRIKQLHDELNRKNFDLELLNKARRDVTDMIVHDLKTPLTAISGTLQILKQRKLIKEPAEARLLEAADASADFMLLMVNDLLDVGRAETAGLKAEPVPFDPAGVVEDVKRLFAVKQDRAGITLAVRVAPELKSVDSDRTLLYRVLANLVGNAMKVTQRGGVVEVEAFRLGAGVRFAVLDRGPGVPEALKREIFEKYSALGPKSLDSGTGIGLTFCRLAAQALGGRVWVEDRPGGGSAFVVELAKA